MTRLSIRFVATLSNDWKTSMTLDEKIKTLRWLRANGFRAESYSLWRENETDRSRT
jgi:hypothetical protein